MTVPELSVLSSTECYELLAGQVVGRLGILRDHYPVIIPVNFAMDGGTIVFRSGPGGKVAALDHANITFEVDEIDRETRTGWSVLVHGLAERVTDHFSPEIIARTVDSGVEPWIPEAQRDWVRIIPHGISGRRIGVGVEDPAAAWSLGAAAYM